jgi:uncharacterized protein RhaS with RHS repeats
LKIDHAEFTTMADFVVSTDIEAVREAIADGAVRLDGEPAADVLARLEASERGELQTVVTSDGNVIATYGLDDDGRVVRKSGPETFDEWLDGGLYVVDRVGAVKPEEAERWLRALPITLSGSRTRAEVIEPRE